MKFTAQHGLDGRTFTITIPRELGESVSVLSKQSEEKHNGYLTFDVSLPHRPRTTGPRKQSPDDPVYQSNMLHGFLSQLAIHFGYTRSEMKEIMKDDVPEWPTEPRRIGKRVMVRPVSEADVSVEVESKAIEWCRMIAGEEGLTLRTWKKPEGTVGELNG